MDKGLGGKCPGSLRVEHLDSLRGIAALCVAIGHFNVGSILNNPFTYNGQIYVDFFFVLSGYVIALNYAGGINDGRGLVDFGVRRFARLYPLHILTFSLVFFMEVAKYLAGTSGINFDSEPFSGRNSLHLIIPNLLLLQSFWSGASWNLPAWSISAEFYTYFLFALLVLLKVRVGWILSAILALLAFLAAGAYVLLPGFGGAGTGFARCVWGFSLGAAVYLYEGRVRFSHPNRLAVIVCVITLVMIYFSRNIPKEFWLLFSFVFAFLILSLNKCKNNFFLIALLRSPFLVRFGDMSYAIYMIHFIIWKLLVIILTFGLHIRVYVNEFGGQQLELPGGIIAATALQLVGLAFIVYISAFLYRRYERPSQRFLIEKLSVGRGGKSATDPSVAVPKTSI